MLLAHLLLLSLFRLPLLSNDDAAPKLGFLGSQGLQFGLLAAGGGFRGCSPPLRDVLLGCTNLLAGVLLIRHMDDELLLGLYLLSVGIGLSFGGCLCIPLRDLPEHGRLVLSRSTLGGAANISAGGALDGGSFLLGPRVLS